MVQFIPLDITDEHSIEYALSHADNAIQYGENLEPKDYKVNIMSDFNVMGPLIIMKSIILGS
jgi:hypothetical protein